MAMTALGIFGLAFALVAQSGGNGVVAQAPANNATSASATAAAPSERFATRSQARIPFVRQIRNFQIKREDNDDILYLETTRNTWFRSEIICSGIDDPRDAHAIAPVNRDFGIDSNSRVVLFGLNRRSNECFVKRLVALTPEENVEFKLVRPRATPTKNSAPNS